MPVQIALLEPGHRLDRPRDSCAPPEVRSVMAHCELESGGKVL